MDQEPKIQFWGPYDDHSPKDSFFENLHTVLLTSCTGELASINPRELMVMIPPAYIDFLKGCLWNFKNRNENLVETKLYFKTILERFRDLKENIYFEKDGHLFHVEFPDPLSKDRKGEYELPFYQYTYLNKAIAILEEYISLLEPKDESQSKSASSSAGRLLRAQGFNVKNQDCLEDAYNQMINLEFISKEVSFMDFEKAFLGHVPQRKITWLRGPGMLRYFIKEINGKGVKDLKKGIWETTTQCFEDINGKDFDIDQLRHGKNPKTVDDIKLVIETFNDGFTADF